MEKKLQAKLERLASAGQLDRITYVCREPVPVSSKIRKKIKATPVLDMKRNVVSYKQKEHIYATAVWLEKVSLEIRGYIYRVRLFAVDYCKSRTVYAVPVKLLDKGWELPDIELSKKEIQILIKIANYLGGRRAEREVKINVDHPALENIRFHKRQWVMKPDEEALLRILQNNPWILPLSVAAVDTQLRSYKKFKRAPCTVYNFVVEKSDWQSDQVFTAVLGAMNFSSAARYADSKPLELYIKEKKDWDGWRKCAERLVLIRTATGSLLSPILKELTEQERTIYCNGIFTKTLFPTLPVVRCRSFLHRRGVLDVSIEKGLSMFSTKDLDTIRIMIANVLSWNVASMIYNDWRNKMSTDWQYRTDRWQCWYETILEALLKRNFSNPAILAKAKKLLKNTTEEQQAAETERANIIYRAQELISSPVQFANEIMEKPASKEDAEQHLHIDQDAVAFWFMPKKNKDAGNTYLAFTKNSLLRLLRRVSMDTELLDAFLHQCE